MLPDDDFMCIKIRDLEARAKLLESEKRQLQAENKRFKEELKNWEQNYTRLQDQVQVMGDVETRLRTQRNESTALAKELFKKRSKLLEENDKLREENDKLQDETRLRLLAKNHNLTRSLKEKDEVILENAVRMKEKRDYYCLEISKLLNIIETKDAENNKLREELRELKNQTPIPVNKLAERLVKFGKDHYLPTFTIENLLNELNLPIPVHDYRVNAHLSFEMKDQKKEPTARTVAEHIHNLPTFMLSEMVADSESEWTCKQ